MQDKKINISFISFFFCFLFLFWSCSHMTIFNETAYSQAIRLKVESLELMEKAINSYSIYAGEADSLNHNLRIAYEYARGRPGNEAATRQWEIMIDPDRNLIGGFLRIWKEDLKLSPAFVSEAKSVIGDAFDTIIGLESGKIKSSDLPEDRQK